MSATNPFIYIGFFRTYREPHYDTDPTRPPVELYGADSIYNTLMTSFIRKRNINANVITKISENIGTIYFLDPGTGVATFLVTSAEYENSPINRTDAGSERKDTPAEIIVKYVTRKLESKIGADFHLTLKSREEVDPKDSRRRDELITLAKNELNAYLVRANQEPDKVRRITLDDRITGIQDQLDDVKRVMHKTIDAALMKGEKLDSLIAKSDNLSMQSRAFAAQAKKQNSCCVVM
ncbi:SNARE Ykt6 [Histoplasma capsulatum G186AR]|uniref:SNARE Ykt6 n=1 Tax=Ajellomyces capsulatus (strain G186AR / H82 / ATCC MYA-2454 / RMSCC 2432) TaxID=447093 RepID=C0NZ60_AJECG|nr:SNARE Ykt6 [Histoplasma capsulatum G186AR]EEH03500.1 SNARE Ykt6 [Histoplasma capsulatum G186AR]